MTQAAIRKPKGTTLTPHNTDVRCCEDCGGVTFHFLASKNDRSRVYAVCTGCGEFYPLLDVTQSGEA